MFNSIVPATDNDREQLMKLYKEQVGRKFCAWDEDYPSVETIDFDLSRDALFVMKENDAIIAAISIEIDEDVDRLECWDRDLFPGGELARLAVTPSMQGRGIARLMMEYEMKALKDRGYKSIHFLVNNAICMIRTFCVTRKNCPKAVTIPDQLTILESTGV